MLPASLTLWPLAVTVPPVMVMDSSFPWLPPPMPAADSAVPILAKYPEPSAYTVPPLITTRPVEPSSVPPMPAPPLDP